MRSCLGLIAAVLLLPACDGPKAPDSAPASAFETTAPGAGTINTEVVDYELRDNSSNALFGRGQITQ